MRKIKILAIFIIMVLILFVNTNTIGIVYADQKNSKKVGDLSDFANTIANTVANTVNDAIEKEQNSSDDSIDSIFNDANDFIKQGESDSSIDQKKLHDTSNLLYNLLLGIGMVLAVIVGVIIGIKYVLGSLEEKADLKQALIGYVVSCAVIFGAFGIWKIVVLILQSM